MNSSRLSILGVLVLVLVVSLVPFVLIVFRQLISRAIYRPYRPRHARAYGYDRAFDHDQAVGILDERAAGSSPRLVPVRGLLESEFATLEAQPLSAIPIAQSQVWRGTRGYGDRIWSVGDLSATSRPESGVPGAPLLGVPLESGDSRWLGGYQVLSRLGRGGFGSVYLGVDNAGQRVAIKVIRPDLVAHAGFRERFRREAASAQRVARHSTAEVLDFDEAGPQPYLVTEFIDGPTLSAWVQEHGAMRGSSVEQLAIAVASALADVHRAGIIHRDFKPSNVLLSATGPRVIDFGISRALDDSEMFSFGTTKIGTLGYMAPEQIKGEVVTQKSDVFAWGAVVAFAATGTSPFGGGEVQTIIWRTLNLSPDLSAMDPPLRSLARRALDKEPGRRPSVADLLAELADAFRPRLSVGQQARSVGAAAGCLPTSQRRGVRRPA